MNPSGFAATAVRRKLRHARQLRARVARDDVNAFMQFVMRDEKTNVPIRQAPVHKAWQWEVSHHNRVLIWSHPESGKTQQLSIGRVLWELGRNTALRVAVISRTDNLATKIVTTVGNLVLKSEELRAVFPHLRKSTTARDSWTTHAITVERNNPGMKEPSVQAFGASSRSLIGNRLDLLVIDDILDDQNTNSAKQMEDMWVWYNSLVEGRLDTNGRVIVVGNAWHPQDFLHRLARQPGWKALRYPVVDDETGEPRWPERWPTKRILETKTKLDSARAGEFARTMLCLARDDAQSRFHQKSIDACKALGAGMRLWGGLREVPAGHRVYTGVDLAVKRDASADFTCLFTIIVHPDGSRQVLNIQTGRWRKSEIVNRIIHVHARFNGIVMVEDNAAQDYILQDVVDRSSVPVKPFTTGRNKMNIEYGVESLSAEMDNGKWIIPSEGGKSHPEVEAWILEMLYYDPRKHTGDRLMASWIAREAARTGGGEGVRAWAGSLDTMAR